MADESRTFKISDDPMRGSDVAAWEETLNRQMKTWNVKYQVPVDGVYSVEDRSLTASVCHGLGLASASSAMKDGVTPALRVKLRNKRLSPAELARYAARKPWRDAFRRKHAAGGHVHTPVSKILQDSWGWAPPVHDGLDLICPLNATLYAICDARVIDVRSGGWWGKGAQASSGHPISDGDGIIQLECLVDLGPFRKGQHFGYGHAEDATVHVGELVKAGDIIGQAGFANAAHCHFMANDGSTTRGVGTMDPRPFVDYAVGHS